MSCLVGEAELREQLLKENAEFRRLAAEHQSYDDQLENLSNKHFLSEEEQIEEKPVEPEDVIPLEVDEKEDLQLQRAIDLLKTWKVFKELPKAA